AAGDIGGPVSRYRALDHPDRVAAVHRTDAGAAVYTGDPADLAPEERAYRQRGAAWNATEGAYIAMQATKPQTASFGLTDSPRRARRLDRGETPDLERQRRRHRAVLHQRRDPHQPHHLLAHRHHRLLHAHVPPHRPDPPRPAAPPRPGPLRLLPVRRRHLPPPQDLARTHRQRRPLHPATPRRPLFRLRRTRALRPGTPHLLPPLSGPGRLRARSRRRRHDRSQEVIAAVFWPSNRAQCSVA